MDARADHEGLRAALDYVRDDEVPVVWKLDRLGRSLPHLMETVSALEGRGVGFRSLIEAVDTITHGNRLIFHIVGALGQERTRAGFIVAAARGARVGASRPSQRTSSGAREHMAKRLTVRKTATRVKVGRTTLYEALRAEPA